MKVKMPDAAATNPAVAMVTDIATHRSAASPDCRLYFGDSHTHEPPLITRWLADPPIPHRCCPLLLNPVSQLKAQACPTVYPAHAAIEFGTFVPLVHFSGLHVGGDPVQVPALHCRVDWCDEALRKPSSQLTVQPAPCATVSLHSRELFSGSKPIVSTLQVSSLTDKQRADSLA